MDDNIKKRIEEEAKRRFSHQGCENGIVKLPFFIEGAKYGYSLAESELKRWEESLNASERFRAEDGFNAAKREGEAWEKLKAKDEEINGLRKIQDQLLSKIRQQDDAIKYGFSEGTPQEHNKARIEIFRI